MLSTVALSEMWGQRVQVLLFSFVFWHDIAVDNPDLTTCCAQPWMQARSAFYSFGGMIPPMVSAHGVATPLLFCGALCFSTALGGSYDIFISMLFGYDDGADSKDGGVENSRSTELSPLVRTRGRSRTRSRTRSLSPGGEFGTKVGGINISDALALRSTENQLESDELALLELIIESKHLDSDKSSGPTPVLDDLVTTVLDATPYCNITDDQRNDPAFEPLINKTLSYASVKIVDTIQKADGDGGSLTANQANFVDDIKESIVLVPRKARILLALMALLFYSCMTSFVGWLPSYFKLKEFSDGSDWTPMGTQMVSTFFFFMTAGCLASIPCSVYISISKMMRVHLALVSSGGVLLQVAIMLGPVPVPSLLLIGAALMGYGISAIFPLVVTIANDYGFTMLVALDTYFFKLLFTLFLKLFLLHRDACATSGLLKGVAIGGICVPLILGYLMKMFGPNVLTLGLAWLGLGLVGTYMVIHVYLTAEADVVFSRSQRRIRSFSSGSQSIGSQGSVSAHHSARARLRSLSTTEYDFENGAGHA